jgi:hypothetical protein
MNKLLTLITLLCSMTFSSVSFGEWTKVANTSLGDRYYIDLERVRTQGDFRYYWVLEDLLEPDEFGTFSNKSYIKGDCFQPRLQTLSITYYFQPMGENMDSTYSPKKPEWRYVSPDSIGESLLQSACKK